MYIIFGVFVGTVNLHVASIVNGQNLHLGGKASGNVDGVSAFFVLSKLKIIAVIINVVAVGARGYICFIKR